MTYKEFEKVFNEVCAKLNINYNNLKLYYEAFTHPTFANENKDKSIKDYERLEFLGDAILDFLVGEYLYKNKDVNEGDMTKIRAKYVCEDANADYTRELGIDNLIMVGVGAKKQGEDKKVSVLGNVFESFLAALYLDHGMDYVRNLLEKWVFVKIEKSPVGFLIDYKTQLQEMIQAERGESPVYEIVNSTGPAHDKTFEAIVKVGNIKLGRGIGKSHLKAEQEAAKDAIDKVAL